MNLAITACKIFQDFRIYISEERITANQTIRLSYDFNFF
jgi:hypothetical protein